MQSLLSRMFRRPPPPSHRQHLSAETWPAAIYAIGDVHGCLVELRALEALILADSADIPGEKWIVMLGDYIDRGPQSAGVLDHLMAPPPPDFRRICLTGNHEVMFEEFLGAPSAGHEWLRFGGFETLASYGISLSSITGATKRDLSATLASYIPTDHASLLHDLPLTLTLPGVVFVHAGVRPGVETLDRQIEQDLLWIREEFFEAPPLPDRLVVHGHTPAEQPVAVPGRICVDTGAFATGILTAVRLQQGKSQHFLSTARAK